MKNVYMMASEMPVTKESIKALDLSNTKVKNDEEIFCHIIGSTVNFSYDIKRKVLRCYDGKKLIQAEHKEITFEEFKLMRRKTIIAVTNELFSLN